MPQLYAYLYSAETVGPKNSINASSMLTVCTRIDCSAHCKLQYRVEFGFVIQKCYLGHTCISRHHASSTSSIHHRSQLFRDFSHRFLCSRFVNFC